MTYRCIHIMNVAQYGLVGYLSRRDPDPWEVHYLKEAKHIARTVDTPIKHFYIVNNKTKVCEMKICLRSSIG